jgi:hypothetical protein
LIAPAAMVATWKPEMNGERENRIDLLRGLSLLLIFIGHAEFTFSPTFQQSRGFCDASEIFVLWPACPALWRTTVRMPGYG